MIISRSGCTNISGGGVRSISSGFDMSSTPYPGYSPTFVVVDKVGTYNRTCYILELLSIGELSPIKKAQLEDTIQAAIQKITDIEKHDLVRSERFDTALRKAMRIQ